MATSRWVTLFSIWDRGTAELLPEVLKKKKMVGQSVLGKKGECMTPWWMGATHTGSFWVATVPLVAVVRSG